MSVPTSRPLPGAGSIPVRRVAALPRAGSIPSPVVIRRRIQGSIEVDRVAAQPPVAQSKDVNMSLGSEDGPHGRVSVHDRVVVKVASRAAAEHPDVGAVAPRVMGATVPGLERVGGRSTSLDQLPKASADVDGSKAFIQLEVSIRYPAPLPSTTEAVRALVREQVTKMTGLDAAEVNITVGALVTDLPAPPRVH